MNGSTQVILADFVPEEDFVVSDEDNRYFRAIVQYGIQVFVQCVGIITNIINIIVFVRAGLKDSITVTFTGLAISDLLHLATYLVYRLILLIHFYFGIYSHIEPYGFSYPFSLYAIYFNDVSMYITVFAALQKCCCVVFPLKFKNTFTTRRTYVTITVIFVVTLAIFLPVLTGLPIGYEVHPITNRTVLDISIAKHYRISEYYWQSIVKIGLTPISPIIVIACLIIMAKKLRHSANFRMESKLKSPETTNKTPVFSKKELRALRAVQLVCTVFVVTSLPPTIAYFVDSVYPPFTSPRQQNLRHVVHNSVYFLGTINASVNILFYFKFNTNYKRTLCAICHLTKFDKPDVSD